MVCHILNDESNLNGRRMIQELMASNVAGIIWGKPYIYSENDGSMTIRDYIDQTGIPVAAMDDYGFTCRGSCKL